MGKNTICLKLKNKELSSTLEYLLASTGYFDFSKSEEDAFVIKSDSEVINNNFSSFLSSILEKMELKKRASHSSKECLLKILAMASIRGGTGVTEFSISLAQMLFKRGYKSCYLSLDPCNLSVAETRRNKSGFGNWIMDSRRNNIGPAEKYIFQDAEIAYIGAPALNINAGDVSSADVKALSSVLDEAGFDFLIVDIGSHLDLERIHVFKEADVPILFMTRCQDDEKLLHEFFEGALPLIMDGKGERPDVNVVSDMLIEVISDDEPRQDVRDRKY